MKSNTILSLVSAVMVLSIFTSLTAAAGLADPDYEFEVTAFDSEYIGVDVYEGMTFDLEIEAVSGEIDVYMTFDLEAWSPLFDSPDFDDTEYVSESFEVEVTGTLYIIFDNDHLFDDAYIHVNFTDTTVDILLFIALGGIAIIGAIVGIVILSKKKKLNV